MTAQRIYRLRKKIQDARTRLLKPLPAFSLLLMYLKFVAVPTMKKISTNARCVYFSPDFLDKLTGEEMEYILCHQVMHVMMNHVWRSPQLASDDYHFACDILVNRELKKFGFCRTRYPHLGEVYDSVPGNDSSVDHLTAEQVQDLLAYSLYAFDERTRARFFPDSHVWWNRTDDTDIQGTVILDVPEIEGAMRVKAKETRKTDLGGTESEENGEEEAVWQEIMLTVANTMKGIGRKGATDSIRLLERMIDSPEKALVDWRKLLNEFLQESVCDYSFSPPDRRFADTGFFLPDFNEKDFTTKEILFMVDTSGSIDREALTRVYAELCGAIEQFGGKLVGQLSFFDTQVTAPVSFESVEDVLNITPFGGGGTDFHAIFAYLQRERAQDLPGCLVILTDGYATYPSELDAMGIPVMWLIDNSDITPPWGQVVRLPFGDKRSGEE